MGLISLSGADMASPVQSLADGPGVVSNNMYGLPRSGSRSSLPGGTLRGVMACASAAYAWWDQIPRGSLRPSTI
jgi:hypothetical protein